MKAAMPGLDVPDFEAKGKNGNKKQFTLDATVNPAANLFANLFQTMVSPVANTHSHSGKPHDASTPSVVDLAVKAPRLSGVRTLPSANQSTPVAKDATAVNEAKADKDITKFMTPSTLAASKELEVNTMRLPTSHPSSLTQSLGQLGKHAPIQPVVVGTDGEPVVDALKVVPATTNKPTIDGKPSMPATATNVPGIRFSNPSSVGAMIGTQAPMTGSHPKIPSGLQIQKQTAESRAFSAGTVSGQTVQHLADAKSSLASAPSRGGVSTKPTRSDGQALDATQNQVASFASVVTMKGSPQSSSHTNAPTQTYTLSMTDGNPQQALSGLMIQQVQTGHDVVKVQLHPEGMGNILISVSKHDNGAVQLQVTANQMSTMQWLSSQVNQLADAVRSSGVDLTGVQVQFGQADLGNSGSSGTGGQPSKRQRQETATKTQSVGSAQTSSAWNHTQEYMDWRNNGISIQV